MNEIGDKVYLKSKEWFSQNYSNPNILHGLCTEMKSFFGTKVTISEKRGPMSYKIKEDNGNFTYCDDMFENQYESGVERLIRSTIRRSAVIEDLSASMIAHPYSDSSSRTFEKNVILHKFYRYINSFTPYINNDGYLCFIDDKNCIKTFEEIYKEFKD